MLAKIDYAVPATLADSPLTASTAGLRRPYGVTWYLVIPALVFYVFAVLMPAVQGVTYSFTDWNSRNQDIHFIGLDNFTRILTQQPTINATLRTIFFALLITISQTFVGLGLALVVSSRIKGRHIFRALFFAPLIVVSVVTAFLWRYMLAPDGAINRALDALGLSDWAFPWLGIAPVAVFCIIVVVIWQQAGLCMAIFLAGLESIPGEVIEASELDGAVGFTQLRYIKWPLLRPAAVVAFLVSLVGGLRMFDQIWILTQGGPASATETLSVRMYKQTFVYNSYGSGVTMAVILAVIVAGFALVQHWWMNREPARIR